MKNQRLAAIDIGTNTFRLLVAEVHPGPGKINYSIKVISSKRTITRLGDGIAFDGVINEQSVSRSIRALKQISRTISRLGVDKVSAVATSALREAKNSREFLEKARAATGIDIKVISGKREAEITAEGMLLDIPSPESAFMIDIGGGSTELIFMRNGHMIKTESLDLGVVYLAGKYMRHDPPSKEDLIEMEKYIAKEIKSIVKPFFELLTLNSELNTLFIGTAGTVTALAAMSQNLRRFNHNKIHKFILTSESVSNIFSTLSGLSSKERAEYIPFELARLDIIVPGTLILLKLMESFKFREITVSNYGLLEGTLIDLYKKERE